MVEPQDVRLVIRRAGAEDLVAIVAMLADDPLGAVRERLETPLPACYRDAFARIDVDPHQELLVAALEGEVVGTLQLIFIPGLSHQGALRAQIESVRVRGDRRGAGVGRRMVSAAIERARQRGCRMVQLTSDRSRHDAHRFWRSLGFEATHEGMKLVLVSPPAHADIE